MSRAKWWNPRLGAVSFCVTLLILHFFLEEALLRFDIVSSIFAAGNHVPKWMLACAGSFIIVRLSLFFVVPVIISWRIAGPGARKMLSGKLRSGG